MKTLAIWNREINPGRGRGSLRVGRTGARARVVTDDDGASFYVVTNYTKGGSIDEDRPASVSTNFDDAGAAGDYAKAALVEMCK